MQNAPEIFKNLRGTILLRHCKERVEITFLLHQFIKGAGFCDAAVPEGQNTVIPLQQVFVQRMGDNDPGQTIQIQDRIRHLKRCLRIQSCRGFIHKKHL